MLFAWAHFQLIPMNLVRMNQSELALTFIYLWQGSSSLACRKSARNPDLLWHRRNADLGKQCPQLPLRSASTWSKLPAAEHCCQGISGDGATHSCNSHLRRVSLPKNMSGWYITACPPFLLREGWAPQIWGKICNIVTELRIRITTRAVKKEKKKEDQVTNKKQIEVSKREI